VFYFKILNNNYFAAYADNSRHKHKCHRMSYA